MKLSDIPFFETPPNSTTPPFLWEKSEPLIFSKILKTQIPSPPFSRGGGRGVFQLCSIIYLIGKKKVGQKISRQKIKVGQKISHLAKI